MKRKNKYMEAGRYFFAGFVVCCGLVLLDVRFFVFYFLFAIPLYYCIFKLDENDNKKIN